MIRRAFWFVSGVVAGVSGLVWTKKKAADIRESMTPGSVARRTLDGSAAVVRRVRDAIAVGRQALRQANGSGSVSAPVVTSRRHIATRPRKTHR